MISGGLFLRTDVECIPFAGGQAGDHYLYDPLALKYSLVSEKETFLLEKLEQGIEIPSLCHLFEERFSENISPQALEQFMQTLRQQGWAIESPYDAQTMTMMAHRLRVRRLWAKFANPLAIRFRGIDPTHLPGEIDLLQVANCLMGWIFQWPWIGMGLLLAITSLTIVLTHPAELFLAVRLATGQELVFWQLAICLCLVKILHELAHGVASLRHGAHCHELGVMLFVGTPVLYCDVTDSWRLPSRWSRMAIAAAGIYIELWIASLATLVWWLAEPGLVSNIALQLMLICGISSLIFNGNPLLKYDGYFILADALKMPNLADRSRQTMTVFLDWCWLGLSRPWPRGVSYHNAAGLIGYAVASSLFRLGLMTSILIAMHTWLKPYGLDIITWVLGSMLLVGTGTSFVNRSRRYFTDTQRRNALRTTRARLIALAIVLLVTGGLLWPWPASMTADGYVIPHEGVIVRSPVSGRVMFATSKSILTQGEIILELDDLSQKQRLLQQKARVATQKLLLEGLLQRQVFEPAVQAMIPTAEQELQDLEEQLAQWEAEEQRHQIKALVSGRLITIPRVESQARSAIQMEDQLRSELALPTWSGSILDPSNRGAFVEAGAELAWIAPQSGYDVLMRVSQSDIVRVSPGQEVIIWPQSATRRLLIATITAISNAPIATTGTVNRASGSKWGFPAFTSDQRVYEVKATLNDASEQVLTGMPVSAKIQLPPESWFRWLMREFRRILRIDW